MEFRFCIAYYPFNLDDLQIQVTDLNSVLMWRELWQYMAVISEQFIY